MDSVCRFVLGLGILLLFISSGMAANSVGAVPGVYQFGEVERGETVEGTIYISTNIDRNFEVRPEYSHPISSIYGRENPYYGYNLSTASQENMSSWVRFTQDSFTVDPSSQKTLELSSGGKAVVEGKLRFKVTVPEDAEPGYHVGGIELNPDLSANSDAQSALLNLGVANPLFVLKVPGEGVKRELELIRLNGVRPANDEARIDILVRNTGDTTAQILGSEINISRGNKTVGKANFGSTYIRPGEVEVIEALWRSEKVSSGAYSVETELDYLSDTIKIESTVNVPQQIQASPEYQEVDKNGGKPLMLIFIIVGLVLTVLIYLDIKAKWSVIFSVVLGILLYLLL